MKIKNEEKKITPVLQNFIDELSKGYNMTKKEKQELERIAIEDAMKLYEVKQK